MLHIFVMDPGRYKVAANIDMISMEHGSGGALSRELVEQVIYPFLKSDAYAELDDASLFTLSGEGAFTTDTFVVDPLFFP